MTAEHDDSIWRTAWAWVQREHGRKSLDEAARVELVGWLLADPVHRKAYDKAARLWLLTGLVPPTAAVEAWKKSRLQVSELDPLDPPDDA
jgi:ferric-dicitrate binding protein FerR (iron transport regulator)